MIRADFLTVMKSTKEDYEHFVGNNSQIPHLIIHVINPHKTRWDLSPEPNLMPVESLVSSIYTNYGYYLDRYDYKNVMFV